MLLVHPMLARTVELATSYEMQAIGRVRRLGQARKEIHVWRFYTRDTVEQELSERRSLAVQRILSRRKQVGEM